MSSIDRPEKPGVEPYFHFCYIPNGGTYSKGENVWGIDFMDCVRKFNEKHPNADVVYVMNKTERT